MQLLCWAASACLRTCNFNLIVFWYLLCFVYFVVVYIFIVFHNFYYCILMFIVIYLIIVFISSLFIHLSFCIVIIFLLFIVYSLFINFIYLF